jgi:hypothetical protein
MFLSKLNVIVRAEEAAPMLGVSVADACRMIEKGDQAAIGGVKHVADHWGKGERSKAPAIQKQLPHAESKPAHQSKTWQIQFPSKPISLSLCETPPIPPSVCLDITTSKSPRQSKSKLDQTPIEIMDQGFFRCITKELSGLKVSQLVLTDLSVEKSCPWLPSAITFTINQCKFNQVVLHIDPLSADMELVTQSIAAGLSHLVINFNLASGNWRAKSEAAINTDANFFQNKLRQLIQYRDQIETQKNHRCKISIIQINHKSIFHLSSMYSALTQEAGLEPFEHISTSMRNENHGECHCWSPFIEAHIKTNGHLVACAQDHSGYSFTADLKETGFAAAWQGQTFASVRQRALHGGKPGRMCEICPHLITQQKDSELAPSNPTPTI